MTHDVNDAARVKLIKVEEVELKNHISVLRGTKPNVSGISYLCKLDVDLLLTRISLLSALCTAKS